MGKLFLDSLDMYGLVFWSNDAVEMDKEIKNASKPKK